MNTTSLHELGARWREDAARLRDLTVLVQRTREVRAGHQELTG